MFDGGGHIGTPSALDADRAHASASLRIAEDILAVVAVVLLVGALAGLISYAFDFSIAICVPPNCRH